MPSWKSQSWLVLKETFRVAHSLGEAWGMAGRWLPVPGLAVFAVVIQGYIPGIKNLYPWAFSLIVALVSLGLLFFLTAVRLQSQLTIQGSLEKGWKLKTEGEAMQTRMIYKTENDIDRYSDQIDFWSDAVRQWLGGTGSLLDH